MSGYASSPDVLVARSVPGAQRTAMRAASFGILAVLLVLAASAVWGAASTYRADVAVKRATEASQAVEQARRSLGAIRLVRRTAGPTPAEEARAQHREATASMAAALQRARIFTDPPVRRLVDELLAREAAYVRAAGPLYGEAANESLPLRVFDPAGNDQARPEAAFNALEALMDVTADRIRSEALSLLNVLVAIQTRVFVGAPVFFALGLLLIGVVWRIQRGLQRRGTEALLRDAQDVGVAEKQFRRVVDQAPDLVLVCAGPGTVSYHNCAAESVWSHPQDALVGKSVLMMAHPEDRAALRTWWEQMRPAAAADAPPVDAAGASGALSLRWRDGLGDWRPAELRGTSLLQDPLVKGVVLTVRDVTARTAAEQRMQDHVLLDPLTRLPNPLLLRDRLKQALARAGRRKESVSVLHVSLDGLQPAAGATADPQADDRVMEAATRILACVRPQDTVGRVGPASFVVVRDGDEAEAIAVAEAIGGQFSRAVGDAAQPVFVTVRIGIALGDPLTHQTDDVLRNAALAMRLVGTGSAVRHVVFGATAQSDTLDRIELESDLRSVMQRRDRPTDDVPEFRVHFQPIMALQQEAICGVEALIRWQHPRHGLVPPRDFIPMAEETGLIVPLGQWVLEEGCRRVMAWQRQFRCDPHLSLSVNLSSLQFRQPGLVADVARALSLSGLPPGCLRLEVTEGTLMHDPEGTVRTLWSLKELGVQLAIDDFGAGYSALSFLKQLPLGLLKVDGSFISGIGTNAEDTSIVRAVMSLARSLGWGVTAEGIETEAQATLLKTWGCNFGQGYFFGRPLDAAGTEDLLRATAERRPAPRSLVREGAS